VDVADSYTFARSRRTTRPQRSTIERGEPACRGWDNHGRWQPPSGRPDPLRLHERQARTRVPSLVPIRYGRIVDSPYALFHEAATGHDRGSCKHTTHRVERSTLRGRLRGGPRRIRGARPRPRVRPERSRLSRWWQLPAGDAAVRGRAHGGGLVCASRPGNTCSWRRFCAGQSANGSIERSGKAGRRTACARSRNSYGRSRRSPPCSCSANWPVADGLIPAPPSLPTSSCGAPRTSGAASQTGRLWRCRRLKLCSAYRGLRPYGLTQEVDGEPRIVSDPALIVPVSGLTVGRRHTPKHNELLALFEHHLGTLPLASRRPLADYRPVDLSRAQGRQDRKCRDGGVDRPAARKWPG
jgi:hypothetical protein